MEMNLRKVYDHTITVSRGGGGMMGFIQPVCSCGWIGREHYNYCNSQHSNFDDNAEEHLSVRRCAMTTIEAVKAIQRAVEGYVPTRPCPVCDDFRNLNKLITAAESAAKAEAEAFNKARDDFHVLYGPSIITSGGRKGAVDRLFLYFTREAK